MKRNSKLLIIVLLLTVFVTGISLAYFFIDDSIEGLGSQNIGAAPNDILTVKYEAGDNAIIASDILPGETITKDFSVSISPSNDENTVSYIIRINIKNNTFTKCNENNWQDFENECSIGADELIYTLKDENNNVISMGYLEEKNGNEIIIKEKKTIDVETEFKYIFTLEFKDTNLDQNHNANATFNGDLEVIYAEEVTATDVLLANKTIRTRENTVNEFAKTITESTSNIIYSASENSGTTYYFAGAPLDNYVKFAGYYWRIIRINENGSIRMIYSGKNQNSTGVDVQIGTGEVYNDFSDNDGSFGYIYNTNSSKTESNIKRVLDEWYVKNLLNYWKYIDSESGFCNDLTLNDNDTYNAKDRIFKSAGGTSVTVPTFDCIDETNYLYTISKSKKGNKSLIYPIGLITADEVNFAGGVYNTANNKYYLYTGTGYWTMTPNRIQAYDGVARYMINVVHQKGLMSAVVTDTSKANYSKFVGTYPKTYVNLDYGVRPVINLKPNVTLNGAGTAENPYTISYE